MNDIKDILNKMKFVPEHMQDEVLKNIKKCVEKEINKSCNPIDLVVEKLKELKFGETEKDTEIDRRIIRIIISCLSEDWFWTKPFYCESIEKEGSTGWKYHENKELKKFFEQIIKDDDSDSAAYEFINITDQCYHGDIDIEKDSIWFWRDGSNGELWVNTTQSLAQEMLGWFKDCFYKGSEEDIECSYKILNKLEKSFPKKD